MDRIEVFKRWISESNRIVAFTGAGVSTESPALKIFEARRDCIAKTGDLMNRIPH